MRITFFVLALGLGSTAAAQARRALALVPGARITTRQPTSPRDVTVAEGPDGKLVVAVHGNPGELTAYDSTGAPLPWKLAVGRGDSAEIMYPAHVGWISGTSTMWVADPGYRQVVLVDARGAVTKSIENPSWLHPHWADRRKFPVFAAMDAFAVYRDSSMLVMPLRERSFIETPGYDRSVEHVVRVSRAGVIERTIATLPIDRGRVTARGAGQSEHTIAIPFAVRTFLATSSDGMRLAIVAPGVTPADSGVFVVTALNDRGDTLFCRRYPQPVARTSQEAVDQFLGNIRGYGTASAEQLRASVAKEIPMFRSFVTGVLVGYDHSTWTFLRSALDSARERSALVLDEHGDILGRVAIPPDVTPMAVDRGHLWAMNPASVHAPATLVRYTIVPTGTQSTRSGQASASSKRLHPPA